MSNYDLTSPRLIAEAARIAREHAGNEPNQNGYNAAWLHGYASALADTAKQLEPLWKLVNRILDYLSEHNDDSQLYQMLHQDLEMSPEEVASLGFCLDCSNNKEDSTTMNKDFNAVAVGYYFGLIPVKELEDIALKQTSRVVRFDEQNWTLFKADSFEDSRKIDSLLDKYGEHALKEHSIEPVIMCGEIEMKLPGFNSERDSFLFGGYEFVCDGKNVPVDFSGVAWDIKQEGEAVVVSFETGRTPLLTDYFLDDCYEDEYAALGLRINDITAEFLSQASSISEFMVSLEMNGKEYGPEDIAQLGGFSIRSLSFENDVQEYSIARDILDTFNERFSQNKRPSLSAQIQTAENRATGSDLPKGDPERGI